MREPAREGFFRIGSDLLRSELGQSLTRDELLLYLLHCRGYDPKVRCSLMGEKAALHRLGLRKKAWRQATERLTSLGLVLPLAVRNHRNPHTCLAGPSCLFEQGRSRHDDPRVHDRHRYEDLVEEDLIMLPWRLIDGWRGDLQTAASLRSADSIRLLLWCYEWSEADGLVVSLQARALVRRGNDPLLVFGDAGKDLAMDRDALVKSSEELLGSGLVTIDEALDDYVYAVRLLHPLELRQAIAAQLL